MKMFGTRTSVMYGLAEKTSGGLRKEDLIFNKHRKIVSKKKSMMAINKSQYGGASSTMRSMSEMEMIRNMSEEQLKNKITQLSNEIRSIDIRRESSRKQARIKGIFNAATERAKHRKGGLAKFIKQHQDTEKNYSNIQLPPNNKNKKETERDYAKHILIYKRKTEKNRYDATKYV
jgi:hypothetical protein